MSNKTKGVILTGILALAVVFIFFGKIIQDPNNYYFSAEGDGFKAYYGAIYHLEHDTSAMRMNGMNYPYGEMVFFTGSQPLVVNTVKFVSNNLVDISDNIVGVMNLLMLFSIVVAALFIFLIFHELEVNWLYAVFVSVGICMLSPQVARFGGHFSLSWVFWLPLMIYLVIRFDKNPNYISALFIGVVTFLAGGMHMYFYGFYGFIIGLYLLSQVFCTNRKFGLIKGLLFFVIQFILPFLIFQSIISLNDPVSDRTAFPYGFWAFMGHPLGVFLPSGKPYAFVPKVLTAFRHVSWESLAFIGIAALFGFWVGTFSFFKKLFRKVNPLTVTDSFILNVLFWSSFAALLFSFGIPFILGLEALVDNLGPLRQLRALARFSWLFFYMLNIVVFYGIYKKMKSAENPVKWSVIALLAIGFLIFDGSYNCYINSRFIQNRKPLMLDIKNELSENEWIHRIDPDDFQAIIPLPYFHVGSENIWIESKHNNQELAMVVSLKTGLPMTAVQLSRTSISQTYKNYALVTEPFEPLGIIDDLPNKKPFLLLFNRKYYADEDELRLIRAGELLFQNKNIELRKLSVQKLEEFNLNYLSEISSKFAKENLFAKDSYFISDSVSVFIHKNFDEIKSDAVYAGAGSFEYPGSKWNTVLDDTLKVEAGKKYKLSFWMNDYRNDGFLRTVIEFVQRNPETQEVNNYFYSDAHRHIKGFQGSWALIEVEFETKSDNELIKMAVKNSTIKDRILVLDELLIREKGVDVYYPKQNTNFKNGRKLPLK